MFNFLDVVVNFTHMCANAVLTTQMSLHVDTKGSSHHSHFTYLADEFPGELKKPLLREHKEMSRTLSWTF